MQNKKPQNWYENIVHWWDQISFGLNSESLCIVYTLERNRWGNLDMYRRLNLSLFVQRKTKQSTVQTPVLLLGTL